MRGKLTAWMVAGMLVGVVSCDGSSSLPFSQLEPSALAALCHIEVLCGAYPDAATCMASEEAEPHYYDTLSQDISSGKVIYDGVHARECLDMLNAISSCVRSTVATLQFDTTCSNTSIFTGTVAAGGPCFFSEECASGGTCQTTGCTGNQCCAGTCAAMPTPVAVGGDCSAIGATCVSGSSCVFDSSTTPATEICQKPGAEGAPCVSIASCANPLYCDTTSATCKSPAAEGGACDPSVGSLGCDDGNDRCDPTTMLCTPRLAPRAACDPTNSGCVSYAVCDATTSTCVERPLAGASCDATNGPSCLGGTCDATTSICTLTPAGGACS